MSGVGSVLSRALWKVTELSSVESVKAGAMLSSGTSLHGALHLPLNPSPLPGVGEDVTPPRTGGRAELPRAQGERSCWGRIFPHPRPAPGRSPSAQTLTRVREAQLAETGCPVVWGCPNSPSSTFPLSMEQDSHVTEGR